MFTLLHLWNGGCCVGMCCSRVWRHDYRNRGFQIEPSWHLELASFCLGGLALSGRGRFYGPQSLESSPTWKRALLPDILESLASCNFAATYMDEVPWRSDCRLPARPSSVLVREPRKRHVHRGLVMITLCIKYILYVHTQLCTYLAGRPQWQL